MSRSAKKKPLPPPVDEEAVSRVRAEVDRREALLPDYERHGPPWWHGEALPGAFGLSPGFVMACRVKSGKIAVIWYDEDRERLTHMTKEEARAKVRLKAACDSLTCRAYDRSLREFGPLGGNVPP